jgi:REP element-mobilizing transposase RayT
VSPIAAAARTALNTTLQKRWAQDEITQPGPMGCRYGGMPYSSRRSVRLKGFDYAQPGAYFITVCTHRRQLLFGDVVDGEMRLNAAGKIVRDEWSRTAQLRPNVRLDAFVVMPDHIHIIIVILRAIAGRGTACRAHPISQPDPHPISQPDPHPNDIIGDNAGTARRAPTGERCVTATGERCVTATGERFGAPTDGSIPTIVRAFKSAVTKRINEMRDAPGSPVWQRGYHEHVIRDVAELDRIRRYVANNPRNW